MWVCKIKIDGENALVGGLCNKYGITAAGYPLSNIVKDDEILVYFIMNLFCDKKTRLAFFEDLKNSDRIFGAEIKGHCIIGQIKESIELGKMYRYNIFHVEPVRFNSDGYEVWTVASWNKKELIDFCNLMKERYNCNLMFMKERPISNVSVLTLLPDLTESQRRAIDLAIENKYYDIPRGILLEELAKLMNVSYSTYQNHLRKAEKKLMPFFSSRSM